MAESGTVYLLSRQQLNRYTVPDSHDLIGILSHLATAYEGHFVGHYRHEQHIGIERQGIHLQHRLRDVFKIKGRFGLNRAICLRHAFLHPFGHWGGDVTDINLPTGNIIVAAIQRN